MEQRWKLPHLFHNGASSSSTDVGEKQQLCCRDVHLLLFQKSLGRELLTEAGIHRPGWCCPRRLGGFLIASSNCSLWPSEEQCCLWAMGQTQQHSLVCAVPRSLKTLWPTHDDPRKNEQQCGTSCHRTLVEGSHTVGLYTQSSRAHSLCAFPILPRVLPLLQVGFLLVVFSLRHRHWKRSTGFEMWAKNSSWIPRSGWMTLRISVFESDALLGQPSLIPTADGTLSYSFWGDCKLRWYQAVFMESCHVPEPAGTRSP